jgi:hypothetical protein
MTLQQTIEVIGQIPIIQLILAIFIAYMLKLAIATYKSLLNLWSERIRMSKIKLIIEERKLINNDKELEEVIIKRLGQSSLSKSIEKQLNKGKEVN